MELLEEKAFERRRLNAQIDELKKDNENLANQSMILLQREAELELQMQKMKCCTTCKYYNMKYLPYWCDKLNEPKNCWRKCDDWKLKEKENEK